MTTMDERRKPVRTGGAGASWPLASWPPEIPPPPGVPSPGAPTPGAPPGPQVPRVPSDLTGADDLVTELRATRRLLLTGPLDNDAATRLSAELMLADGRSAAPVELIINSPGGSIDAVLGVVDVIALLRAPLRTRCIGTATGTAAVLLASGTAGRTATPNAMISLRVRDGHTIAGRAEDIVRGAAQVTATWARVARHVATVSGWDADRAADELRDGTDLTTEDAIAAGLLDGVAER